MSVSRISRLVALALICAGPVCTPSEGLAQDTGACAGPEASRPWTPYLGILVRSLHAGNDALNDATPGVTLGLRQPRAPGWEVFGEAGVFLNSYDEIAPIAMVGASRRVASLGPAELRVGASAGTAYYKDLSEDLEERYGIPNVAGFLPVVAASAALRLGDTDIRLTTVPPDTDTDFILNLSLATRF